MAKLTTGMVVAFPSKGRMIHGVVTHIRRKRGGGYELIIAPLHGQPPRVYQYTFPDRAEHLLGKPTLRFTEEQILAATTQARATEGEVLEKKQVKVQAGREALGDQAWKDGPGPRGGRWEGRVNPGDEVLIGYREGPMWETVGEVNWGTGKIGIVRRNQEALAERRQTVEQVKLIGHLVGLEGRTADRLQRLRGPRELRWLPATLVRDVRPKAK